MKTTNLGREIPPVSSGRLNLKGEALLYFRISQFMKRHYPNVIYRFDVEAGLHARIRGEKSKPMVTLLKQLVGRLKWSYGHEKGYPDLFIAHPANGRGGLYLELKREGARIHKKNGDFVSEHVERQALYLERLRDAGYGAFFAVGDEVFNVLEDYLGKN